MWIETCMHLLQTRAPSKTNSEPEQTKTKASFGPPPQPPKKQSFNPSSFSKRKMERLITYCWSCRDLSKQPFKEKNKKMSTQAGNLGNFTLQWHLKLWLFSFVGKKKNLCVSRNFLLKFAKKKQKTSQRTWSIVLLGCCKWAAVLKPVLHSRRHLFKQNESYEE